MIDLTPLEVRKKKGDFRRGMRGYDPQSVDDFLDMVADRLEQLVRENGSLNDRVRRSEDQVNDYRERERALTEALVTAQEMREQMRQQIEVEAQLKRREAEADADSIRAEAEQIREREEESIRRLRARQSQFVQSYRAFLERELAELSVMTESLDLGRATESNAPSRRPRKRPQAQAESPRTPEPEPEPEWEPELPEPQPMPLPRAVPLAEAPPLAAAAPFVAPAPVIETPKPVAPPAPPASPRAAAAPDYGTPIPGDDFDLDGPFIPEPEPDAEFDAPFEPEPARAPETAMEKSFDDMLNELPAFNVAPSAPAKPSAPAAARAADEDAELLADVRAQFDAVAAEEDFDVPPPAPMPEADADDVLELVDDAADDEDEDGWMSTLLEGRGDDSVK